MKPRTVIAPLLCAAALLPASTAEAGWKIERAQQVAQAVFPVACDDVQIRWSDLTPGQLWVAWTFPDDEPCVVYLRSNGPRWPWGYLCTVMVHEYGHLAGLPHSDNPRSVMAQAPLRRRLFPGCRDRGRKLLGMRPAGQGWD